MKSAVLIFALVLTGCSTVVPVKPKFPESVKELTEQCKALQKIEGDSVAITDMLKVIINNYALYYECSAKVDGWNEWYNEQKKIYEGIK
jgi:PBP1b-binding outer membrane lipoprotein LpoB